MIIVSNRLPVSVKRQGNALRIVESSGGLVRALAQVFQRVCGVWIGWSGADLDPAAEDALRRYRGSFSFNLHPVNLSHAETSNFYYGFSNEIIWPLFHDLQSRCNFDSAYWQAYVAVNRKFARATLRCSQPDEFVWVHDYHLVHVAEYMREARRNQGLGFFLHIPFPPPDIFNKLPWRVEYLKAILQYDLAGFQTPRDLRNFAACIQTLLPEAEIAVQGCQVEVQHAGRRTVAASFPISIDFRAIADLAADPKTEERFQQLNQCLPQRVLLSVDRLDYTKGIPERLIVFQELLRQNPELHRKVILSQVVVPSREAVPRYKELRREVERRISSINGEFSEPGWTPVQYIYRSLSLRELVAYYRAADVALVTPLKDGMNLVAKEYCAARINNDGVLVLSEFAGAAEQLKAGALLVNPYDAVATAQAIRCACEMPEHERRLRMEEMRRNIQSQDVFRWVEDFHQAARKAVATGGGRRLLPEESLANAS
jgi:trehalose 6-phosphate synthase